jgi:hypothetical protein
MNLPEIISELRNRNEPVPKPPRLPTEAEVIDAEQRMGVRFPSDYRYFLLHGSDVVFGSIEPGVVTPEAGHLDLVQLATDAWELGAPRELLPFCESNGDYYCLNPSGQVVYWSHNGVTDESWPDLAHWIQRVWIEENEDEG